MQKSAVKGAAASSTVLQPDDSYRLTFYTDPPSPDSEIGLDEFQDWAAARLKVLDSLDSFSSKISPKQERQLRSTLNKHLPATRRAPKSVQNKEIERDVASHYILRLSFCRTKEDRKRFVRLETELFKLRYSLETSAARARFVRESGLNWQQASDVDLTLLEGVSGLPGINTGNGAQKQTIYRFAVEECMDLLGKKQIYASNGIAFVPESLQLGVLAQTFSSRLMLALEHLAQHTNPQLVDTRLQTALESARSGSTTSSSSLPQALAEPNAELTLNTFEELCKRHDVPLCIEKLYQSLKSTNHAYYPERNQFVRFLHHSGMPYEETIKLYARYYANFDKKKDIEYSIKHWYGLVGSRKSYSAESCSMVCKSVDYSKPGLASGCPYQKSTPMQLNSSLHLLGITDKKDTLEIQRFASENQPHLACARVYALTHPDDTKEPVQSPNEYFQQAYDYEKAKAKKTDTA